MRNRVYPTLYFLFFYLVLNPLFGQQVDTLSFHHKYYSEFYGIEEGLPDVNINDIYQDKQGFLWLASRNGISRFDGKTFENFKHDPNNENGLGDNRVNAIHQSEDGLLWVGTFGGLNRIDPNSKEMKLFAPRKAGGTLPGDIVIGITPDPNANAIWVCMSATGVARLDLETETFTAYQFPHLAENLKTIFKPVHVTKDGTVWAGAYGNIQSGLWKLNPATNTWEHALKKIAENQLDHKILDIVEDETGCLWLATRKDGLIRFDPKTNGYKHFRWNTGRFYGLEGKAMTDLKNEGVNEDVLERLKVISRERYETENAFIKAIDKTIGFRNRQKYQSILLSFGYQYVHNAVYNISKADNSFFLATPDGVYAFDLEQQAFQKLLDGTSRRVEVPMEGKKGLFWIAQSQGVAKVPLDASVFERFAMPSECSNCPTSVQEIIETEPGSLYLGREGNIPLTQFNEDDKTVSYIDNTIIKNPIGFTYSLDQGQKQFNFPLEVVQGELWFGGAGLNRYVRRPPSYVQYKYNGVPVQTNFLKADGKIIWHTTDRRLASFDVEKEHYKNYKLNSENFDTGKPDTIINLEIDPHHHVWFWQDYSNILFEFDPVAETFTGHDTSYIMGTLLPTDSLVWIGNEDGLYSYSPHTKEKRLHRPLGENIRYKVYDIVEYANNDLWMSTSRGLLRYNPRESSARLYDEKDGVPETIKTLYVTESGYIYAGYQDGFFRFDPNELETMMFVPPVVLTGLSIFNEPVDFRQEDSPLEKPLSQTESLTLQHSQDYLTFDFIFASHLKSEFNRYMYMLEGVDKDWIETNLTQVTYTSIPSGEYTFMVKAVNVDGQWSDLTQLSIKILPPWWAIWWVRAIAIILFLLSGFLYYKYRMRQLNKRNEQLEEQVRERTMEIKQKHEEILTQNEELRQTQEELEAQRDHIEVKNNELVRFNQKLQKSELILKKMNDSVKEKNKELTFIYNQVSLSIASAQSIQKAILPTEGKFKSLFQDYFILNRPKDVVSGDFYWLSQKEEKIILIVSDCTGHGVPGAFMTLIGHNLLEKIINYEGCVNPHQILHRLNLEVRRILRQEKTDDNNGMDVAVITLERLEEDNIKVTFSGAKNGLYYHQPEDDQLRELKGSRKSIGGHQNESKTFLEEEFILKSDSVLYLGSDGLSDQNDEARKKFSKKRIRNFITQHSSRPLKQQKTQLEEELDTFMTGTTQRDDILLIGVKV